MSLKKPVVRTVLAFAIGAITLSCGPYDGVEDVACPSKATFTGVPDKGMPATGVTAYLERRCGTLDCHGSSLRPLRIYGRDGLRDPYAFDVSGGKGTTPAEAAQNYGAVCDVEPEKMQDVVSSAGASADKLLLVRKARGIEGHKGGTIFRTGSAGDRCVTGWLAGQPFDTVTTACQAALDELDK
jgi:hypothetical protein